MRKALVLGAGGFVGGELLRLLATHPHLELAGAVSDSQAGRALVDVHPQLSAWTDLTFISRNKLDVALTKNEAWILFAALPHGESMKVLPSLVDSNAGLTESTRAEDFALQMIDLSGDFRLSNAADYPRFYGREHTNPALLKQFCYGLAEVNRDAISRARFVANPGCFATALSLAVAPAADTPWRVQQIAMTGMTGSSGAGAIPRQTTHHPYRAHNIEAYRPLHHQHLPEVRQVWLGAGGKTDVSLAFTPHRTPLVRGIVVAAQLFCQNEVSAKAVEARYAQYYAEAPFVRVLEEPPAVTAVWGTNRCDLSVTAQGNIVAVSAVIDNLVKGAAGQAIQNANLINRWEETAGLCYPAPAPV